MARPRCLTRSAANVYSFCKGDDDWRCRVDLQYWANTATFGYVTPMLYAHTLSKYTNVIFRYTDAFAFVHRGNTYSRETNNHSPKPADVDLMEFEAVILAAMTDCMMSATFLCQTQSLMTQNVSDKKAETFSCVELDCTST